MMLPSWCSRWPTLPSGVHIHSLSLVPVKPRCMWSPSQWSQELELWVRGIRTYLVQRAPTCVARLLSHVYWREPQLTCRSSTFRNLAKAIISFVKAVAAWLAYSSHHYIRTWCRVQITMIKRPGFHSVYNWWCFGIEKYAENVGYESVWVSSDFRVFKEFCPNLWISPLSALSKSLYSIQKTCPVATRKQWLFSGFQDRKQGFNSATGRSKSSLRQPTWSRHLGDARCKRLTD